MVSIDFSHGGNIHEIKSGGAKEIIDFSSSINPLGPSRELKSAVSKNLPGISHYPDPEASGLIEKIASRLRLEKESILAGNGSAELIYIAVNALKPETALIPAPAFCEYERAARCAGSKISFLKLKEKDNFKLTSPPAHKGDIVFIGHPNNPVGNFMLDDLSAIEKYANKLLLIDEAFMDFIPEADKHTFVKKAVKSRKTAVLRTFTKMFAIPGLRIGYLIGHPATIDKLKKFRPPWNTNFLAQKAAESAVRNSIFEERSRQLIKREKEFIFKEISRIGELVPFPSLANFILIKLNYKSLTSTILQKKLIPEGILIRDCSNFRGLDNKYIRVAVRSRGENLKLIKAFRRALWQE